MTTAAGIEVTGLSVDFPLYHGTSRSLKKTVFSTLSGRMSEDGKHRVVVEALRDVNFRLRPGDRLGLIGGNGAGKTTLLRTLAGIYEPVSGAIKPQVLLMDEWFLAGDAAFMEKARERLEDMVRGAEILVLSTHSPAVILDWCTRVIWMDQGRVRDDGAARDVVQRYLGGPLPDAPKAAVAA